MEKNKFEFNYSAPSEAERKEIEGIRRQYLDKPPESKMDRLRRLDRKVKGVSMAIGISLGVVGILVFGLGLTMILEWGKLAFGAIVALAGAVPVGFAYPAYNAVFKKQKKKYKEEILQLSSELLSE